MAQSILGSFGSVEAKRRELNKNDVEFIYYKDIKPADKNRTIRNAEELAEDILEDGLEHNILVRELENNPKYKYEIVAGHRRYTAICILIKKGHTDFEYIPCKVKKHMDDMEARRRLHLNNINQSGYTPAEMLDAIEELQEIYKVKKKDENIPGRIQKLIAEDIGLQKTQIGNYQYIINNATPEVRALIREKNIPIATAMALCTLDNENQIMFIETEDDIDLITIKEYKMNMLDNNESEQEKVQETLIRYEEDDLEEYEESENSIIESEKPSMINIDTSKKLSLSEMGEVININMEQMLDTMRKNTEWKKEQNTLEDLYSQFNQFLTDASLKNI